jgi:molybdate transport system substrate-binding protein
VRLAFGAVLFLLSLHAAAQELVVSAAASLTNAFRDIGKSFEAQHQGVRVLFNFAASDILVTQISKGAPADVFASADEESMNRGIAAGAIVASTRRDFAANALVLVVPTPASSPRWLADLAGAQFRRIALGSPQTVPAGRYAKEALEAAGVWPSVHGKLVFAQNVRQVLDYVAREEAEAGFVYATDAAIAHDKVKVALDVKTTTPIRYPIAVTTATKQPRLAQAFAAYVEGSEAQAILRRYGFRAAAAP